MLYVLNRIKRELILFLTILVFFQNAFCQELPPIENFSTKDYQAENQNWAISQTLDKLIYVANNRGLLEFNGAKWKLYSLPNESIVRSVHAVENRIYTGSFMEFGYWERDDLGILNFTSISQEMNVQMIEDEEFWHILNTDDGIVFQSLNRIYIYNKESSTISIINSTTTITNIFKVNQTIYFQKIGEGIFKIENGKDSLVIDSQLIKDKDVINIFSEDDGLLIVTRDDGFYSYKNGILEKWDIAASEKLTKISVYNAIRLRDKSFALATISDGLIYLDSKGELVYHIDQNNGISNNTVLAVFEDDDETIWLGLDNGVSYVNRKSPFREYIDDSGMLGSVYTSAIVGEKLYLGTNQGLFYKELGGNDEFKFIQGTQGQVWFLKEIHKKLFCGHNLGTFIIDEDKALKISNIQGTWNIDSIDNKPNLLLQGNYDGLYILEKKENNWKLRNKIEGFDNSSRFFEVFGNEIFVNHEYKGVFKLNVDSTFNRATNVAIDTLIKGSNSGIIKYKNTLLYAYEKGIYRYDTSNNKFRKDTILSKAYTKEEYMSGKLIVDENENLWTFTDTNVNYISTGGLTNVPKINNIPLKREVRKGVVGYENVLNFDDKIKNTYLLGTTAGYISVNLNALKVENFQVHIDAVVKGSSKKDAETKERYDKNIDGIFKSEENNLEFSYYTPKYKKFLSPNYQFQLLGIYDDWSNWSENATITFENLPYGDYTFRVRAKIGNTLSNNIASYTFKIEKPWYISNSMIAVYILGVLLFSIFMHNLYKRYYSKQRKKLIEKNKREFELAQLQNEKEIIRIKNEQLEADVKNKSKELAASTMSIIKKNELLTTIKGELYHLSNNDSVKPVINIIDKNLSQNDDWELFQEAFNNADSGFLKKVKTLHPSLSPNDLKLCAYLRLNLSSKEIAPLLNISSRSVEIKRYRLRKKLNLLNKENLVNYILEL